jgi:hypothetical protein
MLSATVRGDLEGFQGPDGYSLGGERNWTTSLLTGMVGSGSLSKEEAASSFVPAVIRARAQPYRRSLRQAQGAALRKAGALTCEPSVEAMDPALGAVTAKETRDFSSTATTTLLTNCCDRCSRCITSCLLRAWVGLPRLYGLLSFKGQ